MNVLERWSLHLAALATATTGLLYGWTRYFGSRLGEFGPEPHPWQGAFQHAHVLASPFLVFALGMLVKGHAIPALRARKAEGRGTGLGLLLVMAPLVLSGYLLQVVVDPTWRTAFAWIHGPLALLFLLAWAGHLLAPRLRALRARPLPGMLEGPGTRSSVG